MSALSVGADPRLLHSHRNRYLQTFRSIASHLCLLVGSIAFIVPFLWMVDTSLKTRLEAIQATPTLIPTTIYWQNYLTPWDILPFNRFILNSCIITFSSMIGYLFTSSLVAFAFARLKFKGQGPLFILVLATMMLPSQVTIIPQFVLFRFLGWINTLYPLIVPAYIGGSAFYIFLMRQFFLTVPRELDDAARIDGSSSFGIYWRILLPLAKPALATVAIFAFINSWNDFFGPLIYLTSPEMMTIAVGIQLFKGQYSSNIPAMMAASTLAVIPIIAIFFIAQKQFIQGIALSGIKG